MNEDKRRITLVNRLAGLPERRWDRSPQASSRIVLVDSFMLLRYTIVSPIGNFDADVQRIILDRSSSASEYLALLAELPHQFTGDVLMIRDDESGFLSALGRGGDRVLYALSRQDLTFYLETHELVDWSGETTIDTYTAVLPYRPRVIAVA